MDASLVTASKPKTGGAVFYAPKGTTLPTDTTSTLNDKFLSLGYISEDGVTNANSPTSESLRAWGGDTVLNYQTEKPDTFQFTLLEALNVNVLKAVYGENNVSGDLDTGLTVTANSSAAEEYSWVVDTTLKGGIAHRVVIPAASIIEIAEINYKDNAALCYGVKISAVPDDSGNTHYEYTKRG